MLESVSICSFRKISVFYVFKKILGVNIILNFLRNLYILVLQSISRIILFPPLSIFVWFD